MICSLFGEEYLAVRYWLNGGRFGDNLLNYLHAKWFAFEHEIPLLYQPFPYSSELVLDEREARLDELEEPLGSWVYDCLYFPEVASELSRHDYKTFPVAWGNKLFRKLALELIAPKKPLKLSLPPPGVSAAIHLREGGGLDPEGFGLRDPLKCPPLSFYIESLNRILDLIDKRMIYCRLFTDALDPTLLRDSILLGLKEPSRIVIECREEGNGPKENVLEDFFSLFHYDLLIRPASNFSLIPSLLRDYAIVCFPLAFSLSGGSVEIEVGVEINKELLYQARLGFVNFDSARHTGSPPMHHGKGCESQIEAKRSDRRGPAPSGQGEEAAETREGPVDLHSAEQVKRLWSEPARTDRFGEVAASQNSQNLTARGIGKL